MGALTSPIQAGDFISDSLSMRTAAGSGGWQLVSTVTVSLSGQINTYTITCQGGQVIVAQAHTIALDHYQGNPTPNGTNAVGYWVIQQ